ncbi:MAG: GNAT family N-acetyltransferase [Myxacorys californica WJT36-NPBG1]|jgi:ribosomal-protein-serine acetyltransferase|nr:GNAT family N-acetyltransferase [Myxacorys californica WJT36-NPBG1]
MFSCPVDQGVVLKLLQPHHSEALFAVIDQNRQHLQTWMPWVDNSQSSEDTRKFIELSLQLLAEAKGLACGIWFDDTVIGSIGLTIDKMNRWGEIGYWLSPNHQGKGVMTKSCRCMMAYAFEELKLNRLVIQAAVENHRSRAIAERLGFVQEGIARQSVWARDRYLDLVTYSLLAEEWKQMS